MRRFVTSALVFAMLVATGTLLAQEHRPIRLMYQTTAFGAPLIVALEKGWYEEALNEVGYTLETSTAVFGPPIVEAMAAGEVDIGELGVAPHVVAVGRGLSIKAVLTTNIAGESVMVHRDSPIESLEDLSSKKIAIPAKGNMQDFIIRRALLHHGIDPSGDVEWVELSPADMSTALVDKQIDAAVLWEPWTSRLVLQGHRVLATGQEIWPDHDNQLIAVTEEALEEHAPAVEAFVDQTLRGLAYIMDNPEDAISITARHLGLEREIVAESWKRMIRRRSGVPNAESLQDFANTLHDWGYIQREIGEADMIQYQFVER